MRQQEAPPQTGPQTTRWCQPGTATPVPTCMVGRRAGGPGQTAHSAEHPSLGRQQHGARPSLGGTSQPTRCCGSILTAPRQGLAAPIQAPAACRAVAHLPSTRRPPQSKGGQQTRRHAPHRRGQLGEAAWEGATEETGLGTGERAREASPLSPVTCCSLPRYTGHSRLDSKGGTHRGGEAGVG